MLFDLASDPAQLQPIRDAVVEARLLSQIGNFMEKMTRLQKAFRAWI